LLGLWRVEGVTGLYEFIKPEIIVVLAILGNQYYEHIIGLYDKRETDVETIHQARERFIFAKENRPAETKKVNKKLVEEEEEEEFFNNDG
jgi:hypothetical protein